MCGVWDGMVEVSGLVERRGHVVVLLKGEVERDLGIEGAWMGWDGMGLAATG